ncbi:MAG: restriction endonuclease subunit S [Aeromonadaceae bacterium]
MAEQIMQETAGKAIPAGYKQTEVGVIPEHWAVFSLGDIFSFKNGLNKAKSFFGFGYPIVNYMDVYSSCSIDGRRISGRVSVGDSERKNYSAIKNDVFFTRTSETVDEIGLASVLLESVDNTVFSGFLLRARQRSDFFVGNYMKYCLREKSIRNQIQGTASYTTRALTNGSLLSKILIPVPTKQEQTAIANVLSDSDALIDALEQLIAKKQAIKSATMQQLLTGRTRLPAFALRPDGTKKGYKPSELGDIPEDWEVCFLADIANLKNGYAFKSADYCSHGKYCIVTIACVQNGYMNILDSNKLNKLPFDIQSHQILTRGSLLISMTGNVGRVAKVECDDLLLNQRVGLIESKNIDRDFLFYLLRNPAFLSDMEEKAVGGAQGNIGKDDILSYSLIKPACNKEQTAIATILSDMDNELQALTQKLEKARALKQGMMQQLLTGKIRLPLAVGA